MMAPIINLGMPGDADRLVDQVGTTAARYLDELSGLQEIASVLVKKHRSAPTMLDLHSCGKPPPEEDKSRTRWRSYI